MLPEENKDKHDLAYTTAVDVWGCGVLAYELLVGFPPFVSDHSGGGGPQGTTGAAFLAAHATRKSLSFPASTSPAARDFISLALAERPEERPTSRALLHHPWLAATSSRAAAAAAAQQ
ncbi:Aurora kinase B, partial [Tetrabaena socialis]